MAEANLQIIQDVYAAFGRGDVPGVLDRLSDDVHSSTPGPPAVIPYAGEKIGHDQVAGYFRAFGSAVETTSFEPQHFFADGDMVMVLGHSTLRVIKTGVVVDTTGSTSSPSPAVRPPCSRASTTAPQSPRSLPDPPGRLTFRTISCRSHAGSPTMRTAAQRLRHEQSQRDRSGG